MSNLILSKLSLSILGFLSISAYAESQNSSEYYRFVGFHDVTIPIKSDNLIRNSKSLESLSGVKTIELMSIVPSESFKEKNRTAISAIRGIDSEKDYSNGIYPFNNNTNDSSIDLGMNSVPVLDQGHYGTCVTFASTAALNAIFGINDGIIDQQCILALNNFLGNNYWHGAYGSSQILDPLIEYGTVTKGTCFNRNYPDPSQMVSPTLYRTISNIHNTKLFNYNYTGSASLEVVKSALRNRHRVVMGFAVSSNLGPISVIGFNARTPSIIPSNILNLGGLWACKQTHNSTNYCEGEPNAAHQVVIIGFDDSQQLLKIRNSWGSNIGVNGDFYMTYTFFNAMALDHTELRLTKKKIKRPNRRLPQKFTRSTSLKQNHPV